MMELHQKTIFWTCHYEKNADFSEIVSKYDGICLGKGRKHSWKWKKNLLQAFSPFWTRSFKGLFFFLRTRSVTKKEMNKCMAEIYDPGGIQTRAARLISQYHNH